MIGNLETQMKLDYGNPGGDVKSRQQEEAVEILKGALTDGRATTKEEAELVDRASATGAGIIKSPSGLRFVDGSMV